jgi:hypothetical protein
MDGMAPDAKIAMFDLGITDKSYLKVPAVSEIFDNAYAAGARIHTNSWGNNGGIYGQMSYDVDAYLSENEDFFILFAAGNSGHDGASSIIAPGNAKNCLSVGAAQNRGVIGDKALEQNSRVASFSSLGPTFDGRIKPDVVAPGDYIMSAFAGPIENLHAAMAAGEKVDGTCAVHQMSGTSMATPVTAGTAILVRQFFMDPNFWSKLCRAENKFCIEGAFAPSGFLLKALFLHSGRSVSRYSDPVYDAEPTAFPSFLLESPPDNFQGYGAVTLSNILPLENDKGLDPTLNLMVYDWLLLKPHQTYKSTITISADKPGPIKVTIAWFDPPSVIGSIMSLLIHDMDLVVRSPDGVLHWGNEDYANHERNLNKRSHGDNKNPNEQVFIAHPKCTSSCTYEIFIRAHSLFAKETQNVALVVTTSGVVSDPKLTHEWFGDNKDDAPVSRHANVTYMPFDVKLAATLRGADFASTSFNIPTCGHLRLVKATLNYDHLHCGPGEAIPSNIELTLQAPSGKAVSIGGSDSSVGKALITTEWPDTWNVDMNGEYTALIDLTDAKIGGYGTWTMYVMNSFSSSGKVSYDLSTELLFYGSEDDSCAPTQTPTGAISTDLRPLIQDELLSAYDTAYEIPFNALSMAIKEVCQGGDTASISGSGKMLAHDRVVLATFPFSTGVLQSIKITVDAFDDQSATISGTDAFLLAVLVTAPDEKLGVQVGGHHWLGRKDNFYYRHWPDPWLGRVTAGAKWSSSRDVSGAGLTGILPVGEHTQRRSAGPTVGKWVVELALGSNYARTPVNYTGSVTLMFRDEGCASSKSCERGIVRVNSVTSHREPASKVVNHPVQPSMRPLIILGLIALYLFFIAGLRCMQITKKPRAVLKTESEAAVASLPTPLSRTKASYGAVV